MSINIDIKDEKSYQFLTIIFVGVYHTPSLFGYYRYKQFHDVINSVKLNKVQWQKIKKQNKNIKSNKLKKYRLLIAERNENKREAGMEEEQKKNM